MLGNIIEPQGTTLLINSLCLTQKTKKQKNKKSAAVYFSNSVIQRSFHVNEYNRPILAYLTTRDYLKTMETKS